MQRANYTVLLVLTVIAGFIAPLGLTVARPPAALAAGAAGDQFFSDQVRLLNSTTIVGGSSIAVKVANVQGIPSTVGAVEATLTVVTPGNLGTTPPLLTSHLPKRSRHPENQALPQ